jgi:hypothetical protein
MTAIPCLQVAELALDDLERMLNACPDLADEGVGALVKWGQLATLWDFAHHNPNLALSREFGLIFGADIAFVCLDRRFLTVQKSIPDLTVVDFGGRCF